MRPRVFQWKCEEEGRSGSSHVPPGTWAWLDLEGKDPFKTTLQAGVSGYLYTLLPERAPAIKVSCTTWLLTP